MTMSFFRGITKLGMLGVENEVNPLVVEYSRIFMGWDGLKLGEKLGTSWIKVGINHVH